MKIDQDGRDVLERLCFDVFDDLELRPIIPSRCEQEMAYSRMDSVLVDVIQQRIKVKAVPISMRKRLLYEQSLAS